MDLGTYAADFLLGMLTIILVFINPIKLATYLFCIVGKVRSRLHLLVISAHSHRNINSTGAMNLLSPPLFSD